MNSSRPNLCLGRNELGISKGRKFIFFKSQKVLTCEMHVNRSYILPMVSINSCILGGMTAPREVHSMLFGNRAIPIEKLSRPKVGLYT